MRIANHQNSKNKIRLLLTLTLWLVCLTARATMPAPLLLQGSIDALPLERHVSWLCDPTGRLSLDDVRQRPLHALDGRAIVFGYRQGACWFHFRVENRSPAALPLVLQINFPVLDHIELFAPGSATPHVLTGDQQPFASRPLRTRAYAFPLQLEAGAGQDYFLRIVTTSAINVPLQLSSRDRYFAQHEIEEWLNGAVFGIAIGLIVYHLFLWLAAREKVFRSYVVYVGSGFFYLLCFNGIGYRLWPTSPDWNAHAQLFFLATMLAAACLFTRDYLGASNLRPRDARVLKVTAGVCAVLACLQFAAPLRIGYPMQPLLTIPIVTLIVLVTLPHLRRGGTEARIFLAGWLMVIAMALVLSLQSLGFFSSLPILATVKGVELTFVLQQLLLALALAERLNILKKEKAEKDQAVLRAEADSAAKSEFLARMSHEIRTPMNALLGITQLLQSTNLDRSQRSYVETLFGSGQALLQVINDILDFSKITAGKVELEQSDFSLLGLLDECVQVFSLKAREKSLSLICERSRDLPAQACGDAGRLRQVLLNLLSNATKFTASGTVFLRASVEEQDGAQLRLRFEVEDSGIGIPAEKLPQLFSAFTQADSTTSREYGGTGLGLAISRQLVELMQGRISVSSAPGRGTLIQFSVVLKPAANAAVAPRPEAASDIRFDGLQALVVEDNIVNQMVIVGFLHKLGMKTRVAASGQEAMNILHEDPRRRFDVIFMDCEMPYMDGFEATRRLRQWEKENSLASQRVVALTAHALPEHRALCLAAGMDDYLSKPLLLPRLIDKLRTVLG